MKDFRDFGIKPKNNALIGEKISINKILNMDIIVENWIEADSKFEGKGKCLYLQIIYQGAQRVIFIGSKGLLDLIKQVPTNGFPFKTKIIKDDSQRLLFT